MPALPEISDEGRQSCWANADAQVTKTANDAGHEPKECAGEREDSPAGNRAGDRQQGAGRIADAGQFRRRQWTAEELEFLQACAKQLALAVENFRLLEQVLRSQRQWMNTFDSIHDIILAHDADYRIIKANQVLLEQLGQAAADVIGNSCESALPHTFGEWTGCPYCAMGGDEEFAEGADPCFGGFSVVSTSSYTEQGSPQKGTIHVVRDITERRSAEEKYRLLFEQVQEGVYVAEPCGQAARLQRCVRAHAGLQQPRRIAGAEPGFGNLRRSPSSARPSAARSRLTTSCAILKSHCAARTARCCWRRRAALPRAMPAATSSATRDSCST